jgi:spermidine/putrescine transport system substrate-binding protein
MMTNINRRTILKGTAATGLAIAAPAVLRASDALASSGTVNVFAWGDYIQDNQIKYFEDKTGIKVNLSTYGSNDEAENKLRAAGGKGFDVIFPSITNRSNYEDSAAPGGIWLAAVDESKINLDNVVASMMRDSIQLGAVWRGKRYLIPFNWGTEAVTFNHAKWPMEDAEVSYGALWVPQAKGAAAFRQKSVIMGVGLYLDAIGEVKSDRMLDVYKTEDDARRVWDACAKFIVERKDNIAAFWNNATEATAAFTDAGCTIGQTWDTTGILLNRETNPKWRYTMPKEGGLGWIDTLAIPSGAENVEQAYAFINFMLTPQAGGMFANNTGYNSAAVDADQHLNDAQKASFQMAYPSAEAIDNLWWWPAQTDFFASLRSEYVEKFTNA